VILELTEWKWTILDILEQPEPELAAVLALKSRGEEIRKQELRKKESEDVEKV